MANVLTNEEQEAEWQYRFEERLGILCPLGEPTEEQKCIAREEADKWRLEYLRGLKRQGTP